jgi:hypothetical protein
LLLLLWCVLLPGICRRAWQAWLELWLLLLLQARGMLRANCPVVLQRHLWVSLQTLLHA